MSMNGFADPPGVVAELLPHAITAEELAALLGSASAPLLIDVRSPEEFALWSIAGAQNVPLEELAADLGGLPTDGSIVAVCDDGSRAAHAVNVLRATGHEARALVGGLLAWSAVADTAELVLDPLRVVQVRRPAKGCLSYVVGAAGEAFVVDPSLDTERYLALAARNGWRITRVLDTHLHADHISGARALAQATGASLHLNPADGYAFDFTPLVDGAWLPLGTGSHLGVTAFSAPGHTSGSTLLEVGGRVLLSGDTLLVDGVGRADLAEHAAEDARALHRSLHHKVIALPVDAFVLPAHHAGTITPGVLVGAALGELRTSVLQLALSEDAFVDWAVTRARPAAPRDQEIMQINRGAPATLAHCRLLELGPARCAA